MWHSSLHIFLCIGAIQSLDVWHQIPRIWDDIPRFGGVVGFGGKLEIITILRSSQWWIWLFAPKNNSSCLAFLHDFDERETRCFDRPVGNPDSGRLQGCEATWRVLSLSFALDHGLMNSLPCVSRYQWRMEGFAVFHGWPSLAHSRVNVFFGWSVVPYASPRGQSRSQDLLYPTYVLISADLDQEMDQRPQGLLKLAGDDHVVFATVLPPRRVILGTVFRGLIQGLTVVS